MNQQWPLLVSCKFLYNLFGLEVPNVDMVVLAPGHNPLPACNIKIQRINEKLNKGYAPEFIDPNPGFIGDPGSGSVSRTRIHMTNYGKSYNMKITTIWIK